MNAHALLTSQGWRGMGHTLHPTSDGNGLTHHILMRRNDDGAGLGSRNHHKAEAWWMSAFDQALKGIDVRGGAAVKQTLRGGGALGKIASKGAAKYTGSRGLYHSFVRGGVLQGTVDVDAAAMGLLPTPPDSDVADKEEEEEEAGHSPRKEESKEERRARREAKRLRRERRRAEKEATEDKKKKREKEREERRAAEKKVQKKKAKKAERQAKEMEKEKEKGARAAVVAETKEERRARRLARRLRKEERRRMRGGGAGAGE